MLESFMDYTLVIAVIGFFFGLGFGLAWKLLNLIQITVNVNNLDPKQRLVEANE